MSTTRFEYSDNEQITAIKADTAGYVWVAFAKNTDDNCIIKKQFAFKPDQTYYTLEREVEEVTAIDLDSNNLYVAYNDDSLFGEIISLTRPLTTTTDIDIPVGITEAPIDVKINGSDLWYLVPGSSSGTNAKLLKFNTSGVYQETIDLATVTDAISFTIVSDEFWVTTNKSPAEYIRVYPISGGLYDYTVNI